MSKKKIGATNKRKGSNAERHYAKVFRELGFKFCETARFVSKKHDNAKIDLMYIPFNVQVKAGLQKSMNPGKELFNMHSMIHSMFPEGEDVFSKPCVLFHYMQVGTGNRRTADHEKVYMSLKQFDSFKETIPELEFESEKIYKFDMSSEYKHIVCMTFEYFVENIVNKYIVKT